MLKKITYVQVVVVSLFICLSYTNVAAQDVEAKLCGTWANMEYAEGTQKLIISENGSYVGYAKANPTKACMQGNCKVVEKWSDSAGNRWYKSIFLSDNGEKTFCLMKVSDSGNTIECAEDSKEYPKIFSAEAYSYRKFYRQ